MNFGSLFRDAKESLKGKFVIASIMVFIYMVVTEGLGIVDGALSIRSVLNGTFLTTQESQPVWPTIITTILQAFLIVGYTTSMLNIARGKNIKLGDMLSNWRLGFKAICLVLLETIYILLWSMLLIIPGVIKAYSYSMALYILIENPSKGINECITESREMMNGYKFDLFVLEFCFGLIGFVGAMAIVGVSLVPVAAMHTTLSNSENAVGMIVILIVCMILFVFSVLLRTVNEIACAHFYLKITSRQSYIRPLGDERFEEIKKENVTGNVIE